MGVVGTVNTIDYADLITGTVGEVHGQGAPLALVPLFRSVLNWIPKEETLEVLMEGSESLGFYYERMLKMLSRISNGRIAKWGFLPKDSTCLIEPADYLAFHLSSFSDDQTSVQSRWTRPIVKSNRFIVGRMPREEVRDLFVYLQDEDYPEHSAEEIKRYKKAIRLGDEPDPWETLELSKGGWPKSPNPSQA